MDALIDGGQYDLVPDPLCVDIIGDDRTHAARFHVWHCAEIEDRQGRGLPAQLVLKGEEDAQGDRAHHSENSGVWRFALAGLDLKGFLWHLSGQSKQDYTPQTIPGLMNGVITPAMNRSPKTILAAGLAARAMA
jgi:hypothetical protein